MNGPSLLSVALRPATTADRKRLDAALRLLMDDDPTLRITEYQSSGQIVIWGIAELQLEVVVDRLKREFGVEAAIGGLQVAYKETITIPADGEVKYASRIGGRGQYAHVKVHLFPAEPGTGCAFEDRIVGGAIPKKFIRPIEEGIQEAMARGVLAGYPVDGVKVELYDGSYHDVDSSDEAFNIAGRMAFQKAAGEGRPVLLEPIMRVEVTAPREYADDVTRSVSKRRGHIRSHEDRGGTAIVEARVPLSGMFGYAVDLRSRTEGRGSFVMTFDSYRPVVSGEDGGDESTVAAPPKPSPISGESRVALPEPGEDADE